MFRIAIMSVWRGASTGRQDCRGAGRTFAPGREWLAATRLPLRKVARCRKWCVPAVVAGRRWCVATAMPGYRRVGSETFEVAPTQLGILTLAGRGAGCRAGSRRIPADQLRPASGGRRAALVSRPQHAAGDAGPDDRAALGHTWV